MNTQSKAVVLSVAALVIVVAVGVSAFVVLQNTAVQDKLIEQPSMTAEGVMDETVEKESNVEPEADIASQMPASENAASKETTTIAVIKDSGEREIITLAGGCFWCIEAYIQEEEGIVDAVSGYAGGDEQTATYVQVSKGTTEHREAVQVTYDPQRISTEGVLDIFWSHIDPVDTAGQFADKGYQYTTAIYYHTAEQKMVAEDSKKRLEESGLFDEPVATEVLPFTTFFEAEEYHQDYYKKAADHYERYKKASGRAGFVEDTWAKDAAILFLEGNQTENMNTEDTEVRGTYEYSDEELETMRKELDANAYHVVAEDGTEKPFDNEYWDNKEEGIYVDVVTGEPLFSSTHKYESGTGWPSFWEPIASDVVVEKVDTSLFATRTEVRSKYGDGHLGHVFSDGPEPTGLRYCLNSASLRFVPKEDMLEEGYGDFLALFEE